MLIVDVYNVLHVTGVLPPRLAGPGVPDLVRLISVSRYANRRLTLVCDGGQPGGVSGVRMHTAHILYAGSHLEADDVIERLIERYHRGNSLDVVSTDRRLRRAASRRGANSITSERFLGHLVADESTPPPDRGHHLRAQVPLDAFSVNQWIREFGLASAAPATDRPAMSDRSQAPAPRPLPAARPKRMAKAHPRSSPPSIGEKMRIDWPTETAEHASPETTPLPGAPADKAASTPAEDPGGTDLDPLLLAALEEWRDRLTLDDLDMQRWTPDADPFPRPD